MKSAEQHIKETRDGGARLCHEERADQLLALIELNMITPDQALILLKEALYEINNIGSELREAETDFSLCPYCEEYDAEIFDLKIEIEDLENKIKESTIISLENKIDELIDELKAQNP